MGSNQSNQSNQNFKKKEELNLFVRNTKPLNQNYHNNGKNGLSKEGEVLFKKMELNLSSNSSLEENGGNLHESVIPQSDNINAKIGNNGQSLQKNIK
jgi:hypothetical protein